MAEEHFERVVQRKEIPEEIPLRIFGEKTRIAQDLVATLASVSTSEARRLINQGAVKIDGNKISDPAVAISLGIQEQIIQIGKRRFSA